MSQKTVLGVQVCRTSESENFVDDDICTLLSALCGNLESSKSKLPFLTVNVMTE